MFLFSPAQFLDMRLVFDIKKVTEMILVSAVSGVSAFLLLPFVASRVMSPFVAAFTATVISVPLTWYFLDVPEGSIDLETYWGVRGVTGLIIDMVTVVFTSLVPAAIFMYFLFSLRLILPVPVAAAAALGVYTGYAGFLFRNRTFYEKNRIDIEL